MPDHMRTRVAEQAWTNAPVDVAARLLEVDSPAWLLPFLRVADAVGERAGIRLLADQPHRQLRRPETSHTLLEEIDFAEPIVTGDRGGGRGDDGDGDGRGRGHDLTLRREFLWRTAGFAVLFRRLDGSIEAAGRRHGAVLSVEGELVLPRHLEAVPDGVAAGRRAAEAAVRALLGHLRAALEDPSSQEKLA